MTTREQKSSSTKSHDRCRLDIALTMRGLVMSRSQAEQEIHFGNVTVNQRIAKKPSLIVQATDKIRLIKKNPYVSRAGLKLASVSSKLDLDFKDKIILDVGSSTGGFTDFALKHGASKVIAVDVGTNQLHPILRNNPKIELHEKTDIRKFTINHSIDIALIDVSFISLREILPSVKKLVKRDGIIVAMCKPQFEAGRSQANKGVIKNNAVRREVLKDFETWLKGHNFITINKLDSEVKGEKGNQERFYLLKQIVRFNKI